MRLRNANQICLANYTKICSQKSLCYKGIALFNSLPVEIKNLDSIKDFQSNLKKYVIQKF